MARTADLSKPTTAPLLGVPMTPPAATIPSTFVDPRTTPPGLSPGTANWPGSPAFTEQLMNRPYYNIGSGIMSEKTALHRPHRVVMFMPPLVLRNRLITQLMGELEEPSRVSRMPATVDRMLGSPGGYRAQVLRANFEESLRNQERDRRLSLLRELAGLYALGPAIVAQQAALKAASVRARKAAKRSKLGVFRGITDALVPSGFEKTHAAWQTAIEG